MYNPPMDYDTDGPKNGVGGSSRNTVTRVTRGNTVTRQYQEHTPGSFTEGHHSLFDIAGTRDQIESVKWGCHTVCSYLQDYVVDDCEKTTEELTELLEAAISDMLALGAILGLVSLELDIPKQGEV